MSSAFSVCFLEPTSEFQTPVTFLLVAKTQSVGIHFLSKITRNILVINLSGFAEIFTFSTPAPLNFSFADIERNATSPFKRRDVRTCMTSFNAENLSRLKLYIIKRKFTFWNEYMPFISSREGRKCIFHSWLCHSSNMHFSLHSMK